MNSRSTSILLVILAITLSSCGVITKTRYGNGIKLNLEWGLFSKQKVDSAYLKKYHKPKENRPSTFVAIENHTNTLKPELMQSILEDSLSFYTIIEARQQQGIANTDFTNTAISLQQIQEMKADSTDPEPAKNKAEFEKNAKIAGWLFYGGILLLFIFPIIGTLAIIAGYILAIHAWKKIKAEKKKGNLLRGKGLTLSILIAPLIPFILAIVLLIVILLTDWSTLNIPW